MRDKRTIIPKSSILREKFKVIVRPKLRTFAPEIQKVIITAREKYPEEDAFLELRGKENEEKERICEIKPITITAVSFL